MFITRLCHQQRRKFLGAFLLMSFFGVVLFLLPVHAQDGSFTNPLNTPNPFEVESLPEALGAAVQPWARIVRWVVEILGVIMFAMFLWGGFQYLTAAGDQEKVAQGQKTVLWAVLGGVVILSSYIIAAWLVTPLGNIFGLNHPISSSPQTGGQGAYNDAACCKFTLSDGRIVCRDIDTAGTDACQTIATKAKSSATYVEIPGRCADVPDCRRSAAIEPTGCCYIDNAQWNDQTATTWAGLRCQDGVSRNDCAPPQTFAEGKQCSELSNNYCRTFQLCCVFRDTTKPEGYDCVAYVPYDGTPPGYRAACSALANGRTVAEYGPLPQDQGACTSPKCTPANTGSAQPPGGGGGVTPPPASDKCCVPDPSSWSYSSNRGVCFPPTFDANQNPVCQSGWTLAPQACSSFSTTCTKPRPNPPPLPFGCCYWQDPGDVQPTCTQYISESLCRTDKRKANRRMWFRAAGEPLMGCTPDPGGVDCVYDPNAPKNNP